MCVEEAKEQYWSEDELRNAKIHSNKFLDVVVSDAKEAPYHQQYALIMLNSTKQQHYLHNLWKAATVRVVPEHGLRVVQEQLTEGTRLEYVMFGFASLLFSFVSYTLLHS